MKHTLAAMLLAIALVPGNAMASTRTEYVGDFQAISTLKDIEAFEKKYAGDDPDRLIPQLAPVKERLRLQVGQPDSKPAISSAVTERTISTIAEYDFEHQYNKVMAGVPQVKPPLHPSQNNAQDNSSEEQWKKDLQEEPETAERTQKRLENIRDLQAKYSASIQADTPETLRRVLTVSIECHHPDHRVLPLENAIYISIREITRSGYSVVFKVRNSGPQIQIYAEVSKDGRPYGAPFLSYQLNEKGQLTSLSVSRKGITNACRGTYGPVWLMPGEPGYY